MTKYIYLYISSLYIYLLPKIIKLNDNSDLQIKVTKILVDQCVENLRDTGESFISDIDAQQAWKTRRRITVIFEKAGDTRSVHSYPASVKDPETGGDCSGYLFRLFKKK